MTPATRFARFSRRAGLGAFVRVIPLIAVLLAALLVVGCQQPSDPAAAPDATPDRPATGSVRAVDLGGGVSMNLVYIRSGTFTMGKPPNESGHSSSEGPQTRVTLTEDFWMGETEVTQAQWKSVMRSGNNPSHFKGDSLPVEQVSWNDIMGSQSSGLPVPQPGSFIARLSERVSGMSFTLPTEAQWEYACRAGTTTPFHFGATISTNQANYDGIYTYNYDGIYTPSSRGYGVYRAKTTRVKSFPPNAWGLYDMHGNVSEYCSDWFSGNFSGGEVTNPSGPLFGSYRVYRGGSLDSNPRSLRSAFRDGYTPVSSHRTLGFRVVVSSP